MIAPLGLCQGAHKMCFLIFKWFLEYLECMFLFYLCSMLLPAFSGGKHTVIFRFDEKDYGNGRKWVDAPHNDTASLIHVLFNFS